MAEPNVCLMLPAKQTDDHEIDKRVNQRILTLLREQLQDQEPNKLFRIAAAEHEMAMECEDFAANHIRVMKTVNRKILDLTGDNAYLDQITTKTVELILTQWRKTVSQSTLKSYLAYIKLEFNAFVRWKYIKINPAAAIKLPAYQEIKPFCITIEELHKVMKHIKNPLIRSVILFLYYTGLRANEALRACWLDVDLDNETILIGTKNNRTKNRKSRLLPLSKTALEVLRHLKELNLNQEKDFIFCKSGGFPFSVSYVSKTFKKACRAEKLPGEIHLHSLRHSFCSNLVRSNVPIFTVSKLAGHSSVQVTEKFYAHLDLKALREGIKKLDELQ